MDQHSWNCNFQRSYINSYPYSCCTFSIGNQQLRQLAVDSNRSSGGNILMEQRSDNRSYYGNGKWHLYGKSNGEQLYQCRRQWSCSTQTDTGIKQQLNSDGHQQQCI